MAGVLHCRGVASSGLPIDAGRLERLLEAGQSLTALLDLDALLDHLLETARDLTGAHYAALGILDPSRTHLENFLFRGMDEHARRDIGDLPRGRGVLGVLIEEPQPLRLADVGEHPKSYGFPPGHPPMTTFLGTPILIRGEAWGNLYLTDKDGGRRFDEADERTAVTLASWAAIAIENARLYEGAERRRAELERAVRGLEAMTAIARAVGGETRLERVLELIVKRGRALIDARGVLIALQEPRSGGSLDLSSEGPGDHLVVAASAGDIPAEVRGARIPIAGSAMGRCVTECRSTREIPLRLQIPDVRGALIVPLAFRGRAVGCLVALDRLGDDPEFAADDEALLQSFAASAATAVSTAQSVERDRLRHAMEASEEERKRWARELHDETLQGLGGLRVGLSAALREEDPEVLRRHVGSAVEQIAGEIQNLRSIITDLRPAALDQLGLRPALEALVHRVASVEGLEVDTYLDLPDSLGATLDTAVYRLVQEALTNVAKHARATGVRVAVRQEGATIAIEVADDGRGFDPTAASAGFGVHGMRERIALVGGTLDIVSGEGGTLLRASVPLEPRSGRSPEPSSAGPGA